MLGIAVMAGSGNATLLWIGIALFAVTTVFALVTLPVEYDASNRALAWFQKHNMLLPNEYDGAKDSLKWAARTYLVAAISSLTQLIYFVLMAVGGGRNNE